MKNLPSRKNVAPQFEVLKPMPKTQSKLTERQVDEIIHHGGQAAQGLVDILKGLVNLAHIREGGKVDVAKIEAQTQQIKVSAQAEIDRIIATNGKIQTRGEAAHKILVQLTEMLKHISDPTVQGQLVDTLGPVLNMALHEKTP
jgi:hypothetical protein